MHSKNEEAGLVRGTVAAVVLGSLIALCFVGALHSPKPHDMDLGLVGPGSVTDPVAAALEEQAPGAFDVQRLDDRDEAVTAVEDREVEAAFVPGQDGSELLVAGAAGALSEGALTELFRSVAEANGGSLAVQDLAPLPDDDRAGLSSFLLTMSTVLPSLVMAVLITLLGQGVGYRLRLAAALGGAVLLALVNTSVVDLGLGALDGHFWELSGVVALASFATVAATLALHRLLGPAGLGLSFLLFLVVGMPASGAAAGPDYLPDALRPFTLAFPAGETIPVIRNVVYFDGASIGLELALLATWAGAAALVLLAGGDRPLVGRRDSAPAPAAAA